MGGVGHGNSQAIALSDTRHNRLTFAKDILPRRARHFFKVEANDLLRPERLHMESESFDSEGLVNDAKAVLAVRPSDEDEASGTQWHVIGINLRWHRDDALTLADGVAKKGMRQLVAALAAHSRYLIERAVHLR